MLLCIYDIIYGSTETEHFGLMSHWCKTATALAEGKVGCV